MNKESINIVFKCDMAGSYTPLVHFWEHTVGSCHATMALRADWQQQIRQCRKELGFRHVRFHGLLSDDMGTLVRVKEKNIYSFFNTDQVFDYLLSIGMRPFVELSFMPSALSSGSSVVFHYKGNITPPRDYDKWALLINKLVTHWVARYGLEEVSNWLFEVWNEPNLGIFWTGSQAEYFKLYQYTARAIKNVSTRLQVGGPSTAVNAWIPEFLAFTGKNNLPVDFISTHHYPNDVPGMSGATTLTQLAAGSRSALRDQAATTMAQAKGKPLYYTEWNTSSDPFDSLHDEPYAAAFIIKTIMEANGLADVYSFWTFTDLFEENYFSSTPFHGGFGLMNIHGIPKPSYRAFQLLHNLGNELLKVEGNHPTMDVWAIRKPGGISIMATNWALPLQEIKTETVKIQLDNIAGITAANIERIDAQNANPQKAWIEMGRPDSLSPHEVAALMAASALKKQQVQIVHDQNKAYIEVEILPQSAVCLTLEII